MALKVRGRFARKKNGIAICRRKHPTQFLIWIDTLVYVELWKTIGYFIQGRMDGLLVACFQFHCLVDVCLSICVWNRVNEEWVNMLTAKNKDNVAKATPPY